MSADAVAGRMDFARQAAYAAAVVALVIGGVTASIWLYVTEPWHDGALAMAFEAQPKNAPWQDDVSRVRALFPKGMKREPAERTLRANGFSCSRTTAQDIVLDCRRKKHALFCELSYTIQLIVDRSDTILDSKASSYAACL